MNHQIKFNDCRSVKAVEIEKFVKYYKIDF